MAFLALAGAAEYVAELAYGFELEAAASEAAAAAAQTAKNIDLATGLAGPGITTLVSGGKLVFDKFMGKRKGNGWTGSRRKRARTTGRKRVYGRSTKQTIRKSKKSGGKGKYGQMRMIRSLRKACFGTQTSTYEARVTVGPTTGEVIDGKIAFYHELGTGATKMNWGTNKPFVFNLSNPFKNTGIYPDEVKDAILYENYGESEDLDYVSLAGSTDPAISNITGNRIRKYQMERATFTWMLDTANADSVNNQVSAKIHFAVVEVCINWPGQNTNKEELGEFLRYYIEGRKYSLDKQYKVLHHQVWNPSDVSNRHDLKFSYTYKPVDLNVEFYSDGQQAETHDTLPWQSAGKKTRVACLFPETQAFSSPFQDYGWETVNVTKTVKYTPIVQTIGVN